MVQSIKMLSDGIIGDGKSNCGQSSHHCCVVFHKRVSDGRYMCMGTANQLAPLYGTMLCLKKKR